MSDKIIKLNVGGVSYTTSVSTLTKFPDSMLHRMFSGSLPSAMDTNGAYVIDRDGILFRFVLNFLRDGELNLPENFSEAGQLRREADFFQIEALTAALLAREQALKDLAAAELAAELDEKDETKNCLIVDRKKLDVSIYGPPDIITSWDYVNFSIYMPPFGMAMHQNLQEKDMEDRLSEFGCRPIWWDATGMHEKKTKWKIPLSAIQKVKEMTFPPKRHIKEIFQNPKIAHLDPYYAYDLCS